MFSPTTQSHIYKRSSQVSLVLLGSLVMTGCSRTDTYQYKTIDDCKKDWGEQECRRNGEYRHHGGMFYFYARASKSNAQRAKNAHFVQRGGFGSRFSSGRS